jgi:hypothetical protein
LAPFDPFVPPLDEGMLDVEDCVLCVLGLSPLA